MTRFFGLLGLALLAGCGGLTGAVVGGLVPDVAANVNAGREVTQGVRQGDTQSVVRPKGDVRQEANRVRADNLQTVVVNETPPWVILLAVVGWLLPSPGEIGRWVRGLFRRS